MRNLPSETVTEMTRRYHRAREVAIEAGALLMAKLGKIDFSTKASAVDLVTEADQEAETLIRDRLGASFSDDLIVGEEVDGREGAQTRKAALEAAEFAWCIDPLDGTTNYVHGYPAFSVSIGLLHRGQVALGVVHAPARKETFGGGWGIEANLNEIPIHVSKTPEVAQALLASGFPYNRRDRLDPLLDVLRKVLTTVHGFRRAGSAALDLCDVASGRLDGYYEWGLSPWDLCAGQAIVEAAGGRVTTDRNEPHDLFGGNIVASNGLLHDGLVALVGPSNADG